MLDKSLEFDGAPLHLEPKVDYVQRKVTDRKGKADQKPQVQVMLTCLA